MRAKHVCALTTIESRARFYDCKMHLSSAVRSKVVDMFSLIYCFTYIPLFVGCPVLVFVEYALLYVLFSCAIILTRKREIVALLLLSFGRFVTVNVFWLFLVVPSNGLQIVSVIFSDHTCLLFG